MRARHVSPVGQVVTEEARCGESDRTRSDRLGHHIGQLVLLLLRRLLFDRALAHHVEADGAVSHHTRHVDRRAQRLERVEVAAVVLPAPWKTVQDRVLGDVLDRLHHPGEQLPVAGLTGSEGHSAVSEQRRGHAVPGDGSQQRIPADLCIEVRVDIDEAGSNRVPRSIDLFPPGGADLSDRGDGVAIDGNVCSDGLVPRPVDHHASPNH